MKKKFIVGYNSSYKNQFTKAVSEFHQHIKTVYTSFPSLPNGRGNLSTFEMQSILQDLMYYTSLNIQINLLINATCFGDKFYNNTNFFQIISNSIRALLHKKINLTSITCTNTNIAFYIKQIYPNLKIICSINSDYFFIEQLNQVKQFYDGFYLNKSYNRNFNKIKEFYNWSKQNNKEYYCLINSGCLRYCAELVQHMNWVSHYNLYGNKYNFNNINGLNCSNTIKKDNYKILSETTFYRPQDIHLIQNYFDGIKLATRSTTKPYEIIKAYVTNSYQNNILDLLEPEFNSDYLILLNKSIPSNWISKVTSCSHNCSECGYCKSILDNIK